MSASDFEERVVTVPLRDVKKGPNHEAADYAMRLIREHLAKHFAVDEDAIRLDPRSTRKSGRRAGRTRHGSSAFARLASTRRVRPSSRPRSPSKLAASRLRRVGVRRRLRPRDRLVRTRSTRRRRRHRRNPLRGTRGAHDPHDDRRLLDRRCPATGNENGLLVSSRVLEYERERLADELDVPVAELPGNINAAGNVVLANDYGAYVHPTSRDDPDRQGHPRGTRRTRRPRRRTDGRDRRRRDELGRALSPEGDRRGTRLPRGTRRPGGRRHRQLRRALVGSGLVANESGYVVGEDTTGPELGRIEDALGYLE